MQGCALFLPCGCWLRAGEGWFVCCLKVLFDPIDNSWLVGFFGCFFFLRYFLQHLQNKVLFLYQGVVQACCDGPLRAMQNVDEKLFQDLPSDLLCAP